MIGVSQQGVSTELRKRVGLMRGEPFGCDYALTFKCLALGVVCGGVCCAPVEPGHRTEAAHVQSFLFPGHSSCILQLLAFIRQKQKWNHQLIHTEEQKAFGEGGNPQACSDGSECNVQQFIFIYIFIEYIQNNSETQTKRQTSHSTQIRNEDGPTFFFVFP